MEFAAFAAFSNESTNLAKCHEQPLLSNDLTLRSFRGPLGPDF